MEKGKFYESMVKIYLRLNGYFQTGLISHSKDWGNNLTEIDSIAVRFPNHHQPERQIGFCPVLSPSSVHIEVVLAEVKTTKVEFNTPLKTTNNYADRNWEQILNWIGMFESQEIKRLIPLLKHVADHDKSELSGVQSSFNQQQVLLRPIIFSFESSISTSTPKSYISGVEVIDYLWLCLCPNIKRPDCSTTYPLGNWGIEFEPIVDFIKNRIDTNQGKPAISDFIKPFNLK